MLRTPPIPMTQTSENSSWFVPELTLNRYTHAQLSAIPNVDTITIDPHKSGFCPYPAGATCYRDRRMNSFLGITNQVTYYHGALNLGDVGIEGSKPGAAAAGVVMAHRVILQLNSSLIKVQNFF
jgi:glutamate/tyrosine decarboxylase-like PLP-dependent enzyme